MEIIELIKNSELLKQEDIDALQSLKDELVDVFSKSQVFRTRTEMEVSVLNDVKFPTPDAKYWQSVREQNVMLHELITLNFDFQEKTLVIKKLERDFLKEDDDIEREILAVKIEREKFQLKNMERVAKERIRELKEWSDIKKREKKLMVTDGTNPNDHQLVSYTARWLKQAQLMGAGGSQGERQNLLGQLKSGVRACEERGLLNKVMLEAGMLENDIKQIIS